MRALAKVILVVSIPFSVGSPRAALAQEPPQNPPPTEIQPTQHPTATDTSATGTNLPNMSPTEAAPTAKPLPSLPEKTVESAPEQPPLPLSTKGLPRLHIEANRSHVRLMRIERVMSDDAGEGILVKSVCTMPCDQVIDGRRRQTFFFGAEGMVPSRGFRMANMQGHVVARVDGGSIVARQTGFLLGGFGGAAMLGGITMLGVGYGLGGTHLSSEGKIVEGPNPNLTTGGFVTLGIGAALVTTAVILVLTAKTKITLFQAEDASARVSFEMGQLRF